MYLCTCIRTHTYTLSTCKHTHVHLKHMKIHVRTTYRLLPPVLSLPVDIVKYFGYNLCERDQVFPGRLGAAAEGSREAVGPGVSLHSHCLHREESGLEEVLLGELQQKLAVILRRDALVESLCYWCTLTAAQVETCCKQYTHTPALTYTHSM